MVKAYVNIWAANGQHRFVDLDVRRMLSDREVPVTAKILRPRYNNVVFSLHPPFTDDGTTLPEIPTPDAETQIELFRTALALSESQNKKSYDLVWLLHLVGDVHQPLHCATRVSAAHKDGDRGGNDELVCTSPTKCTVKLHAFWDDLPGTNSKVTSAITYAKALPAADSTLAGELDTHKWIEECAAEAQSDVYKAPIGAGDGPFTITAAYRTSSSTLATKQIAVAGERLAAILNVALK